MPGLLSWKPLSHMVNTLLLLLLPLLLLLLGQYYVLENKLANTGAKLNLVGFFVFVLFCLAFIKKGSRHIK